MKLAVHMDAYGLPIGVWAPNLSFYAEHESPAAEAMAGFVINDRNKDLPWDDFVESLTERSTSMIWWEAYDLPIERPTEPTSQMLQRVLLTLRGSIPT